MQITVIWGREREKTLIMRPLCIISVYLQLFSYSLNLSLACTHSIFFPSTSLSLSLLSLLSWLLARWRWCYFIKEWYTLNENVYTWMWESERNHSCGIDNNSNVQRSRILCGWVYFFSFIHRVYTAFDVCMWKFYEDSSFFLSPI